MRVPVIEGLIDRRVLVNFRVAPDCLSRILPPPFTPKLENGWGIAGICLIRLKHIRPKGLPAWIGIGSENAAHRIAVEWREGGDEHEGVYVLRRDTSSRLNALFGGRLFPGIHHHARFDVTEGRDAIRIAVRSDDGEVHLALEGRPSDSLPKASVFTEWSAASRFFERGSLGYSPAADGRSFDGLELRTLNWRAEPLELLRVESSLFEVGPRFPRGTVEFDSALLMRDIAHEWHARDPLEGNCCRVF